MSTKSMGLALAAVLLSYVPHAMAQSLSNGLIAYYEENLVGSHPDSSGNGFHGTPFGAPLSSNNGKIAGAYDYFGNDNGADPRVQSNLPNVQSWTGGTISTKEKTDRLSPSGVTRE